jgi:outer membrane immunogenic protein
MIRTRWTMALAAWLFLAAAHANAADGFYIGAGAGAATFRENFDVGKVESGDVAYKGFVGWRFGRIPIIDLAVEAAYTDFGQPSQRTAPGTSAFAQNADIKLRGPSLAGLLILPVGPIDLYGKGGVIDWKAEQTVGGSSINRSGTDSFYGVGIGVLIGGRFGIRAEYERFEVKDLDRVDMATVSVHWQF